MSDFIVVNDDVLSSAICEALIAGFQRSPRLRRGVTGGGFNPNHKLSVDLAINGEPGCESLVAAVATALEKPLIDYVQRFPSLLVGALAPSIVLPAHADVVPIELPQVQQETALARLLLRTYYRLGSLNIQKYSRGEGNYLHWHSEVFPAPDGGTEKLERVLFFILYLNDVVEGGETEFLYQKCKVIPRAGRMLVAPAGFTHTHRGNVPRSGDKYVISSWLCYRSFADIRRSAQQATGSQ